VSATLTARCFIGRGSPPVHHGEASKVEAAHLQFHFNGQRAGRLIRNNARTRRIVGGQKVAQSQGRRRRLARSPRSGLSSEKGNRQLLCATAQTVNGAFSAMAGLLFTFSQPGVYLVEQVFHRVLTFKQSVEGQGEVLKRAGIAQRPRHDFIHREQNASGR